MSGGARWLLASPISYTLCRVPVGAVGAGRHRLPGLCRPPPGYAGSATRCVSVSFGVGPRADATASPHVLHPCRLRHGLIAPPLTPTAAAIAHPLPPLLRQRQHPQAPPFPPRSWYPPCSRTHAAWSTMPASPLRPHAEVSNAATRGSHRGRQLRLARIQSLCISTKRAPGSVALLLSLARRSRCGVAPVGDGCLHVDHRPQACGAVYCEEYPGGERTVAHRV